jgi:hypothetical protein
MPLWPRIALQRRRMVLLPQQSDTAWMSETSKTHRQARSAHRSHCGHRQGRQTRAVPRRGEAVQRREVTLRSRVVTTPQRRSAWQRTSAMRSWRTTSRPWGRGQVRACSATHFSTAAPQRQVTDNALGAGWTAQDESRQRRHALPFADAVKVKHAFMFCFSVSDGHGGLASSHASAAQQKTLWRRSIYFL